MDYQNYAKRIKPLINFDTYKKPKIDAKNLTLSEFLSKKVK